MRPQSKLKHAILSAITVLVLAACSGPGPGDTAEKFMTHLSKNEFTEAKQYASESTGQMVEMIGKMSQAMGGKIEEDKDFKFELVEESVDGDKAVIKFRKKADGKVETMNLIKVDGAWKVHEEKK